MNEFIIAFRECLEAALIVGIIYVVLLKNNAKSQIKMVWLSVAAAVTASAIMGVGLYEVLESAGDAFKEFLEGIFMYITAGLLFYVIFWMSKNLASREAITNQTKATLSQGSRWGIFFLVFFAIVREGFETALFLVASTGIDKSFSYIGFLTGVALAVLIGYLIVVQGKRIQLKPFFKWTSLLLVVFAAGMIAYGTHEIHEYMEYREHEEHASAEATETVNEECHELLEHAVGAESAESEAEEEEEYVFDIFKNKIGNEPLGGMYIYDEDCGVNVHMLNANGLIGSFLKGLFGYNTSPTLMEIILWLLSLGFGIFIWRRAYK
ncbi:MAG TPA: FTR1 family protein [Chitinophagales bacterium]|nr:FTR1 family protein [Chitinophagales bacterium]HMX04063.1 FTR1 family protein [Chitinophagales bacterium]HMZ88340.1 FTR1 family protein [Chitinophagales bacterium]HNE44828.1 FTR1 family protein [Chitinophagales bacterium]HNI53046.1 FTR1 family protein [Chitinophagales bacterium]